MKLTDCYVFLLLLTSCLFERQPFPKDISSFKNAKLSFNYSDTRAFKEIIDSCKKDRVLILRIFNNGCSICNDHELQLLQDNINQLDDYEVFILTNFVDIREFHVFRSMILNKNITLVNCCASLIPEENSTPYYIIIDKYGSIRKGCFSNKIDRGLTNLFIQELIKM